MNLTDSEKTSLLELSRSTLEKLYDPSPEQVLIAFAENPERLTATLQGEYPCFVTLNHISGRLRGCIGTLNTHNALYKNVYHFTRQSALHDPRFEPVRANEIDSLFIHIAVLGPARAIQSVEQLTLGREGLVVESATKRGVLLASVPTEYGWTKDEYLEQTCLKAGLDPQRWQSYRLSAFPEISFGEEDAHASPK